MGSEKVYIGFDPAIEGSDYSAKVWYKIKEDGTIEVIRVMTFKNGEYSFQ